MIVAVLGSALFAARAAADPSLVTTVVDPCVPVDRTQLERLLSIELGTSADTASSTTGPTHVHVRCVPAGIELNLQDALTRKGMVRVLSRESFRDASSTRLLALAIAEFVVASWVELQLPQRVEPAGPPPSTAARDAAAIKAAERVQPANEADDDEDPRTQIGIAGQLQKYSQQDAALLGVGVRFLYAPVSSIAFSIGGDFGTAEEEIALGSLIVRTLAVSVAGMGRIDLSPFVLLTGPGARLGSVQGSPKADDPAAADPEPFYAPFGGLYWLVRGELYVAERFAFSLDLELGAVTLPVRSLVETATGTARVTEIDGAWLSAGLGVALTL